LKPTGSGCSYLTARDQDIPQVLTALDQLADGISTQVNLQNDSGWNLSGSAPTTNIFTPPTAVAGSAANMSVVMTDASQVAAAAQGQGSGDSSNASAMAALLSEPIANGLTPSDFYSNFVTALGSTVSQVQTENTAQNASVTQLQTTRDALSSVNLNDEASFMQEFERSYQAASQVFTLLNTVMTSALNLGVETAVS
jgi:flagellar hook-associated protein 1 FlgK